MNFLVPLEQKKLGGIYKITCRVDGKVYVGSTDNFWRRFGQHSSCLKKKTHDNSYLRNATEKHGLDNFDFEIIEQVVTCDRAVLIEREQYHLDSTQCYLRNVGYNINRVAGKMDFNEEVRAKLRAAAKTRGPRVLSVEAKANIGAASRGRVHSPETRAKISAALKGRSRSEEFRKKISVANRGRTLSLESREKIGLAKRGHAKSEEVRSKMSATHRAITEKKQRAAVESNVVASSD